MDFIVLTFVAVTGTVLGIGVGFVAGCWATKSLYKTEARQAALKEWYANEIKQKWNEFNAQLKAKLAGNPNVSVLQKPGPDKN